jgi:hypothetical protein
MQTGYVWYRIGRGSHVPLPMAVKLRIPLKWKIFMQVSNFQIHHRVIYCELYIYIYIYIYILRRFLFRNTRFFVDTFLYTKEIHLLTHSLNEAGPFMNRSLASQEIYRILWNPNVYYCVCKSPPVVPAVSTIRDMNYENYILIHVLLNKLKF